MRGGASCEKLIRVLGFNHTQPMKSSSMLRDSKHFIIPDGRFPLLSSFHVLHLTALMHAHARLLFMLRFHVHFCQIAQPTFIRDLQKLFQSGTNECMDGITLQYVSAVPMLRHEEIIIFQRSFLGLFFYLPYPTSYPLVHFELSFQCDGCIYVSTYLYHTKISHIGCFFFFSYCGLQIISCKKLKNIFQFL